MLWVIGAGALLVYTVWLLPVPLAALSRWVPDVVLFNVVHVCGAGLCWLARAGTRRERLAMCGA